MFVLAAILGLHVHQLDIVTAFFYGPLQDVIYTTQPKDFIWDKSLVCFLKRALYDLRQFSQVWYGLIKDFLQILKFKHNEFDHFVFIYFSRRTYICIYVNNFFIFSSDIDHINAVKQTLFKRFHMTDLDLVSHYLKLSVIKTDNESIIFNERHYLEKILKRFEIKNCKSVSIFINFDVFGLIFFSFFLYTAFKKTFYWYDSTVKSINFAIIMIRFNIFYAIFLISRYCSNSRQKHVKMMTELFRYIKKTIDYGIIYQTNSSSLLSYADSEFVEIMNDRRFIIEWIFSFADSSIFWSFKKQNIITLFTCKTEYYVFNEIGKKTIWMRRFFIEINVFFDISIIFFCK